MAQVYLPTEMWKFKQSETFIENQWKETDLLKFCSDNILSPIVYTRQPDRVDALKVYFPWAHKQEKNPPLSGRVEVAGLEKQIQNETKVIELAAKHWQYKVESPEAVHAQNKEFNIPEQTRQLAMMDYNDWFNQLFFGSLTLGINGDTTNGGYDPTAEIPHPNRRIFCGFTNGVDPGNPANINAALTNMAAAVVPGGAGPAGINYALTTNQGNSGLNTQALLDAQLLATMGAPTTYRKEFIIREAALKVSSINSYTYNRFYLLDPDAYFQYIMNDQKIGAQLTTPRREDGAPSLIKGGDFRGTINGTPIFTCDELRNYRMTVGGHQYCWNMLMGASAFAFIRGQVKISEVVDPRPPYDWSMYIQEYQGFSPLTVNSAIDNNPMNRGIIHIFSQLS